MTFKKIFVVLSAFFSLTILSAPASSHEFKKGRFFFEGDGSVKLQSAKNGLKGTYRYRQADGQYELKAIDDISAVFGLKVKPDEFIAPRLIALLDYLQDELKGGAINIVSGYRSPTYNEALRKKGRLAAKTSMHIEGMAADIDMAGVTGETLWNYVRQLNCCGAGYYHGKGIHVDVGPSRFWDEKTTGVEKDLGGHNKLLLLRTNFDYYEPGERIYMTLGRITDYPVGVQRKIELVNAQGKTLESVDIDQKDLKSKGDCLQVTDFLSSRSIEFDLPKGFAPKEKVFIQAKFCEKEFPEMPDQTQSNPFMIQ